MSWDSSMGNSHVANPETDIFTWVHSDDTMSYPTNNVIQETLTSSFLCVQQVLTNLHTVFFLFLCEHSWDPGGEMLQYINVANIISNALKSIFSSAHSFLVVIWFMQMSWSRHSSFHGVTAVHGCQEHGLSFTLLPLLKCTTYHLAVLTVWSLQQMSLNVGGSSFFPDGGIQLHTFCSYALPCQNQFCQISSLRPTVWDELKVQNISTLALLTQMKIHQ